MLIHPKLIIPLLIASLAGCVIDDGTTPCEESADEDGGDENGEEGATCEALIMPEYTRNGYMYCGQSESLGEHLPDGTVTAYGVTDYVFETSTHTQTMLWDYVDLNWQSPDPWSAEYNAYVQLPGVVSHTVLGQEYMAFMSRGCCPQRVIEGWYGDPLPNAACSGGHQLNDTPMAWCLDLLDGTDSGACVYPCDDDLDCPNPAQEFCDTTVQDFYGTAAGVCRYDATWQVPTSLEMIGDPMPPPPPSPEGQPSTHHPNVNR